MYMSPVIEKCIGLYEQMSQEVQKVQLNTTEKIRWIEYKHYRDCGLKDLDIAKKWNLTCTKQVQRLRNKAKELGLYQEWLKDRLSWACEEFSELHAKIKESNPELAYTTLAPIFAKSIPSKIEELSFNINKNETTLNVTSDLLKQYENLFEEAALLEHCAPQQIHTTQTNK
jgi:hypothetical protein